MTRFICYFFLAAGPLLLGGCATKKNITKIEQLNSEFQCADGHHIRGAPPPDGNEQWCRDEKGINQGPWKLWHNNGALAASGNFRNGLFQGGLKIFDISGQVMQELKLMNGKLHGPFREGSRLGFGRADRKEERHQRGEQ